MLFRQFIDSDTSTYSYLLADSASNAAVLIDPVKTQANSYLQILEELQLKLLASIETHTHADHITAASTVADITGCDIIQGQEAKAKGITRPVTEGSLIEVGNYCLKAIYTPGHTDDSYSFYLATKDIRRVFTGDTLLIRGTGRTDFQNGDPALQYHSLFEKLLKLPDNTTVHPAHDYKGWTVSTIGEERRFNPRLQVKSMKEYCELMNNLNLPRPKQMDIAVPANLRCGNH